MLVSAQRKLYFVATMDLVATVMSGDITKLGSRHIADTACSRKTVFLSFLGFTLAVIPCVLSRHGVKCGRFPLRSVLWNYSFQDAFIFLFPR